MSTNRTNVTKAPREPRQNKKTTGSKADYDLWQKEFSIAIEKQRKLHEKAMNILGKEV